MESDTSSWQAVLEVNGIIGHLVGKVVLEKNTMYLGKNLLSMMRTMRLGKGQQSFILTLLARVEPGFCRTGLKS